MLWTLALAFALPDVDDAVRTGAKAPSDAAVVIGIEDYFMLPDVPHADADARAVRGFLRYTRGVPDARIRMLGKGANREQILKAVEELAPTVGADGTLWVYFAGHGAADPESGERVLLGADTQADQDTFQARAVKLSELHDLADKGKGSAVFLLDTCYTGRSRDGSDLVAGKRFAVPAYVQPKQPNRVEWTAAAPGEWSGPMPGAEHGAFTYMALGALRGWADGHISGSADGKTTVEEAQAFVTDRLFDLGLTEQHPKVNGKQDLVLSVATETAPDLSPSSSTTDTGGSPSDTGVPASQPVSAPSRPQAELPPTSALQKADAQIRFETQQPIVMMVDGKMVQPACDACMYGIAYDLVPGEHNVQAKNLLGKTVYSGSWTVRSGEQLRLFYSRKSVSEQGRVAAEAKPTGTPDIMQVDAGYDAPVASPQVSPGWSGVDPFFQQLHAAVQAEGFAENQVALILMSASQRRLTMAELAILTKEVKFKDDRMDLIAGMQFLVADPANYRLLDDALTFSEEKQLARSLWGN